jgi:hypothetical protein
MNRALSKERATFKERFMKKLFFVMTTCILSSTTFAQDCHVEIDGQVLKPTILKQGSATLVNQDPDMKMTLITCEPFSGQIDGVSETTRLQPGTCTLISRSGEQLLYSCEK